MQKPVTGELPVSHLLYFPDINHGEFLARKVKNTVFIFKIWYLSFDNPTGKKKKWNEEVIQWCNMGQEMSLLLEAKPVHFVIFAFVHLSTSEILHGLNSSA